MINKNLKTKTIPSLGMVLVIFFLSTQPIESFGQSKLFNGLTAGVGVNATSDYAYPRVGVSTDVFLRKNIYKRIGLSLNYHKAKIQKFLFGAYPSHWLDYGTVDTYAEEFIGRSTKYFGGTKGTSFVINASTVDLNIDYKFGKKNKIVPSFGFMVGVASEANLSLRGISSSNGIILTASSQSKFQRNLVYGVNLSITKEYWINNNSAIFFRAKMILTNTRYSVNEFNVATDKGQKSYQSANFGIGILKKLKIEKK